jgi:hypothetical protein
MVKVLRKLPAEYYEFSLGRAAQRMPTKQTPHGTDSHNFYL